MIDDLDFPVEPYRIKVVEPIKLTTKEERELNIQRAHFNIFNVRSEDVFIDLLTDSGTSAMSDDQWAGIMKGDEAYAGCRNYFHFVETLQEITGFKHIIPVHQGRVAENLFFTTILKEGDYVPNNTHFDTTRGNVTHKKGIAVDLIIKEGKDPSKEYPFKGNMDVERLEEFIIEKGRDKIPVVFMTLTNNSAGGQPVSMENIRRTKEVCEKYGIPLFYDAARYAENAYFIKMREPGYENKSIKEIAREMFSYADGCCMSAKKDALVNMGGFLGTNDDELEQKITNLMIMIEGFRTYGGLAGRDLEVIARGLLEALDVDYLAHRIEQVKFLGEELDKVGVPYVKPTGGHAVFVDAGSFLPHIPRDQFPAQALVIALYREGGVRAVEIGGLMFAEKDPVTGKINHPPMELVRLAIPRRVYTMSHLKYVAHTFKKIMAYKDKLSGFEITYEPRYMRHFTMHLKEIKPQEIKVK
ncbi:MAG: tryptophanase [candidate division Zixibacteria bacterium]|nr:tryptophanase [candidate division Zixibacteria bacterium]NIW41801.1 tryptophanase [candidate division Zixibacteria bacterium]NIX56186.1 tryptophanase [candidate division Zixibacteria bacterium]